MFLIWYPSDDLSCDHSCVLPKYRVGALSSQGALFRSSTNWVAEEAFELETMCGEIT